MKRQLILMVWICVCAIGCMAVPAKPGPVRYTQPDGTVITVTVRGDEFGHMIFSEEGLLLMENDGRLEYAAFGGDGIPRPSGMAAEGKGLPESVALTLQSPERIDAWASRLVQGKEEKLGRLRSRHKVNKVPSFTRSEEGQDDEGALSLGFGRFHEAFPVTGQHRVLVILAEYRNIRFSYGTYDYFERFLNEEGFSDYGSCGSVRDWLIENSGALYTPQFDLYGPVTLPERRAYYGADVDGEIDPNAYMMSVHALQLLDDEVDFSVYDCDGDGKIDNVFIIYAGVGEHHSWKEEAVWPHEWFVSELDDNEYIFDGVALDQYACAAELGNKQEQPAGIGTFVHEFSHVMGLPDLYTPLLWIHTPGAWSVLDQGPYNNGGLAPPYYSCFERGALEWLGFRTFGEGEVELPCLEESNVAYAMPTDRENEFFLFENRQPVGNDEFLPGHGMLVWHVEYNERAWINGVINGLEDHQYVDLIEADDILNYATEDGDAFPGTAGVTEFGFRTKPQLVSWSGGQLEFDLTDISESEDGVISFRVVDSKNNTGEPGRVEDALSDRIDPSSLMYDVLGRRISKPAPGQIYIQGGKKRIAGRE